MNIPVGVLARILGVGVGRLGTRIKNGKIIGGRDRHGWYVDAYWHKKGKTQLDGIVPEDREKAVLNGLVQTVLTAHQEHRTERKEVFNSWIKKHPKFSGETLCILESLRRAVYWG